MGLPYTTQNNDGQHAPFQTQNSSARPDKVPLNLLLVAKIIANFRFREELSHLHSLALELTSMQAKIVCAPFYAYFSCDFAFFCNCLSLAETSASERVASFVDLHLDKRSPDRTQDI